ncbi:hypothetical protein TREMEDRAFT_71312 [Tremella mesenterica DSM 1558]|uniref:uncharacterized protein n=1 Tax=Tremella mesenterica (strain ATCC 24925 / CBS 8224 / DSM 1558 / NBRC 9311 / NRRL Y-6157 / RJB 2259-6 / UBC 559-6) TaxID=578456 RepID=UPI0003F490BB|nr:uncharacterized protein TREMEDRAFT_71312 [Tremella mesenterica DSM 1558]EIW70465.1 hypothetical protein TREMEDRAFT_71312 [Tremella mesenterica DSM 1558]
MRGIVVQQLGVATLEDDLPVPKPNTDEVLVKVNYAAANPTDWKHMEWLSPPDSLLGCDYFGTVVEVGPGSRPTLKVGDKVAGFVHGGKFPTEGSFAEYVKVDNKMTTKLPDGWDRMAEAATFGVGYLTAALCLFHAQKNPFPPSKRSSDDWFFVQGGASSVGLFAIQLAKLAGYSVITTCSPHSFDLCKSFGADHTVDYHDYAAAVKDIKDVTQGKCKGALECIGGVDDAKLAVESIGTEGGLVTFLLSVPEEAKNRRSDVKLEGILLYTIGGYAFDFLPGQPPVPASPEDRAWAEKWFEISGDVVGKYGIRGNPVDVRQGLESVLAGLKELKAGVSGKKIVYKID